MVAYCLLAARVFFLWRRWNSWITLYCTRYFPHNIKISAKSTYYWLVPTLLLCYWTNNKVQIWRKKVKAINNSRERERREVISVGIVFTIFEMRCFRIRFISGALVLTLDLICVLCIDECMQKILTCKLHAGNQARNKTKRCRIDFEMNLFKSGLQGSRHLFNSPNWNFHFYFKLTFHFCSFVRLHRYDFTLLWILLWIQRPQWMQPYYEEYNKVCY